MSSIRPYNTFKVDHHVGVINLIESIEQLRSFLAGSANPIILGSGSNVLFVNDTERPVFIIDIKGIAVTNEDDESVSLEVGAGEVWHDLVLWCIEQDYGGIENLSLIPGKCGAAPMQNIGAYGVELSDVLLGVTCMDRNNGALINISSSKCELGYRDSIFKKAYKDQYVITSIKLKLSKSGHHRLTTSYGAIRTILKDQKVENPSIKEISDIVIDIRSSKLPNPDYLPNAGSFFKNPIVTIEKFAQLKNEYPKIPSYPVDYDTCKIPAAWLIDQCGWKGIMIGDVGVHNKQALVIVNHGSPNGEHIAQLSRLIRQSVKERFDIALVSEVNVL